MSPTIEQLRRVAQRVKADLEREDALSTLVKLYGPGAASAEPAERNGVSGYNYRIAITRIAQLVQLERLKHNGLRAEIVSPGKVFVSKA